MTARTDAFLGGRLAVRQPVGGYRAGADPVFLAAAVPARQGQTVLDLGCGAGVAMLCLMARVDGLRVTGVEADAISADLARTNIEANGYRAEVLEGDVFAPSSALASLSFDHVMTNPPFFDRRNGSAASDPHREAGRGETAPLALWLDAALRRLKPGGHLTVVHRAERLADCLAPMERRAGDIVVQPLAPRAGRPARLVLVQARKGARGPLRLNAPLILHDGARHEADGESYSSAAQAVLREGAALTLTN